MAIPKFKKEYVIEALKYIDENGVPFHNQSTKYELVTDDGKRYPPKYVVAIADHLANGTDISTDGFNAVEAKSFLEGQGFSIETKQQEKFELSITAERVVSTDERFTMDNISLGDNYKPLDVCFKKTTGEVVKRAYSNVLRLFRASHDFVRKAEFHSLVCIHPCFSVHQVRQPGTGQPGFDFVSVDDGILHAAKHFDCFLHFAAVTESGGHRIMNHQHRHRRHQNLCAGHRNNGCRRSRNSINLDRNIAFVIHQHIVDLRRRHAVTAGAVDPHRDIAASGHEFVFEKLWCDIIVKPAFLGDRAVQEQCSLLNLLLRLLVGYRPVLPVPELLHRDFPPFRHH